MKIDDKIKEILEIDTPIQDIVMSKKALKSHIIKRRHEEVIKYINNIEDIILNPDYVGINLKEKDLSIEYIKIYDDNVLLAIKVNTKKNNFYVASMYTITDYKLKARLKIGRIKEITNIDKEKQV